MGNTDTDLNIRLGEQGGSSVDTALGNIDHGLKQIKATGDAVAASLASDAQRIQQTWEKAAQTMKAAAAPSGYSAYTMGAGAPLGLTSSGLAGVGAAARAATVAVQGATDATTTGAGSSVVALRDLGLAWFAIQQAVDVVTGAIRGTWQTIRAGAEDATVGVAFGRTGMSIEALRTAASDLAEETRIQQIGLKLHSLGMSAENAATILRAAAAATVTVGANFEGSVLALTRAAQTGETRGLTPLGISLGKVAEGANKGQAALAAMAEYANAAGDVAGSQLGVVLQAETAWANLGSTASRNLASFADGAGIAEGFTEAINATSESLGAQGGAWNALGVAVRETLTGIRDGLREGFRDDPLLNDVARTFRETVQGAVELYRTWRQFREEFGLSDAAVSAMRTAETANRQAEAALVRAQENIVPRALVRSTGEGDGATGESREDGMNAAIRRIADYRKAREARDQGDLQSMLDRREMQARDFNQDRQTRILHFDQIISDNKRQADALLALQDKAIEDRARALDAGLEADRQRWENLFDGVKGIAISFVTGIGSAFENLFAGLVNAEQRGSFGASIIATLGDMASAFGVMFTAAGAGLLWLNPAQGIGLLAAGLAAFAAAGVLKGLAATMGDAGGRQTSGVTTSVPISGGGRSSGGETRVIVQVDLTGGLATRDDVAVNVVQLYNRGAALGAA